MNQTTGDVVYAYEHQFSDGRTCRGHAVFSDEAAGVRFRSTSIRDVARGWTGDVVFDHVRGVRDIDATPLCEPPFVLVWYVMDFDWTSAHETGIEEYAELAPALKKAEEMVAQERASGPWNRELWEVYVLRVRDRFGSEFER